MTTSNTNHFAANFNHRLNADLEASPSQLHDCMNPALERAAAIADLMEVAFERDMANELTNLWRAAQAIRFEIMDAQAMLESYVDGVTPMKKESQSNISTQNTATNAPQGANDSTLDVLIKRQNQEIGLEPLPLEPEILLKRVKDGGHSGQFLADAFISAYRNQPFTHSLYELMKLDAEGFRLFHQILHIRHISGWNDNDLYGIEQQIKAIIKEGVK